VGHLGRLGEAEMAGPGPALYSGGGGPWRRSPGLVVSLGGGGEVGRRGGFLANKIFEGGGLVEAAMRRWRVGPTCRREDVAGRRGSCFASWLAAFLAFGGWSWSPVGDREGEFIWACAVHVMPECR
jgi:hypothetical protein